MAIEDESTGLQSQPFSDYEKVYLGMSRAFKHLNKEHWMIHCVCSIKTGDDFSKEVVATRLRAAWKALASEYLGLMARPVGMEKHFKRPTESNVESWALETFVEDGHNDADAIVSTLGPRDLPALYYLPQASQVVLFSQHWRTDGVGCCMLLDRLFRLFESGTPPVPLESSISPSLEFAAGAEIEENEIAAADARKRIEDFHVKAVQAGGLPFEGDYSKPPGVTTHADRNFKPEETKIIVDACKRLGISVSAAIHTALAQTYFSFAETEAEKEAGYTTVMATNMRPYLKPPYNSTSHACQTYVTTITPTVSRDKSFEASARALTEEYCSWCTPELRRSLFWLSKYNIEKLTAAQKSPVPNAKPPSGVTLSSLGNVERYLKGTYGSALTVAKFRFGVSMMTRQSLLYAWTFANHLTLSLDYNDAYYSSEMAAEIVERVELNLYHGLRI